MQSLPFGIANHICQTAELVTRVIINDIRRFGTVCRNREEKRSIVYSLLLFFRTNRLPCHSSLTFFNDISSIERVSFRMNVWKAIFDENSSEHPVRIIFHAFDSTHVVSLVERKGFQALEDIYMVSSLKREREREWSKGEHRCCSQDFLVPFVQQVEFMAKHPVLAMFHADQ